MRGMLGGDGERKKGSCCVSLVRNVESDFFRHARASYVEGGDEDASVDFHGSL
jgi:hypothetical protein